MFSQPKIANDLDDVLLETLQFLKQNWLDPEVGIVACCLVDGAKKAFATSKKQGNYWTHAERNAYMNFKKVYGKEPSSSAIFVVTLSPCAASLKHRQEDSCSALLNQLNIKRVHFGVLDSMHAESLNSYSTIGLTPSLTVNSDCKVLCERLMSLFSKYDSRINSDLLGIKKELGDDFFNELNNTVRTTFYRAINT